LADTVLIYPPYHFQRPSHYLPFVRPTLVLAHLYAVLENTGIKRLKAIDFDIEFDYNNENIDHFIKKAIERVERLKPDVIAISCKAAQFPFSALFSREYKLLHPDVTIVLGGWMPTLAPEVVLRLSNCDAVIRGEGERSLSELIKNVNKDRWPIKGVSYVKHNGEMEIVHNPNSQVLSQQELDDLPLPNYGILPHLNRYQPSYRKRCFSVEASRGCTNQECIFCWNSTENCDTSWRAKSPKRVVKEIRYLVDKYRAQIIFFSDDNFGAKPLWLSEFISLMKTEFKEGEVEYIASMRLDSMDPSMLKDLYQSGLRTVFHGVESGSPMSWKILGKNYAQDITRQYILDLIKKEVENGIIPTCSFIVAFPNETEKEINETISLCKELADRGSLFSLQILAPNEGSLLFKQYRNQIMFCDLNTEFGESENLNPALRAVFGERLNEFSNYLPDYKLIEPSIPIDKLKKYFTTMKDFVSQANQINILKAQQSQRQTKLASTWNNNVRKKEQSRLSVLIKRLFRRSI
jgi:radical SAM superfamily enzyme YgiQ (UPF0313 family)